MNNSAKEQRKLAEEIIDYEPPYKLDELPEIQALKEPITWPMKGAKSLSPKPIALKNPKPTSPLPRADVVVVTWTVAEGFALGDVLTPGYRDVRSKKKPPRNTKAWYPYRPSNFDSDFKPNLRKIAPAIKTNRLGSYFLTSIYSDALKRDAKVLCFKSELHMNRDWIKNDKSYRTVPVADLFVQIIKEARPKLIITAGTCGATLSRTALGDVMVTRAAQFRLSKAFKPAPFHNKKYTCTTLTPLTQKQLVAGAPMLAQFKDQLDAKMVKRTPLIWFDGNPNSYTKYFPILTTDGFEFGTSKGEKGNYLGGKGCGVEMGDAVLGMVTKYLEKPVGQPPWNFKQLQSLQAAKPQVPKWLVIRNASDPQIDAKQSKKEQTREAVFYYKKYGYWTSVNSSIAVWAAIRSIDI
jgi:hypothetical protein